MDLARLLVLVIYLCFFVGLAQGADLNRGIENYQATLNGQKTFRDLTPEEQVEVMEVMQLLKSGSGDYDTDDSQYCRDAKDEARNYADSLKKYSKKL